MINMASSKIVFVVIVKLFVVWLVPPDRQRGRNHEGDIWCEWTQPPGGSLSADAKPGVQDRTTLPDPILQGHQSASVSFGWRSHRTAEGHTVRLTSHCWPWMLKEFSIWQHLTRAQRMLCGIQRCSYNSVITCSVVTETISSYDVVITFKIVLF